MRTSSMKQTSKEKEALFKIAHGIGAALEPFDFKIMPEYIKHNRIKFDSDSKTGFVEWIRDRGWIKDKVRLLFYHSNYRFSVDINNHYEYHNENLGRLVTHSFFNKQVEEKDMPSLFFEMRIDGLIKSTIKSVVDNMSWFDQFNSPEGVLFYLENLNNYQPEGRWEKMIINYIEEVKEGFRNGKYS